MPGKAKKLSKAQVRKIRTLIEKWGVRVTVLARRFDVSETTLYGALRQGG